MTFDDFLSEHRITDAEREKLAWHLAMYRAKRTYEALMRPKPAPKAMRTAPPVGDDKQ